MDSVHRVAVVTGGAQGIGRATALRLAADGFRLAIVDINAEKLESTSREVARSGAEVASYPADVVSEADVGRVVADALARFGRIDALVNVAGGSGPHNLQHIEEIEPDLWDMVVALNLKSAYLCCRAVMPIMRAQRYGRIVNMSSTLARGKTGPVGTAGARLAYAAAKAGILGFTAQLAKDVGADGITVNALMPWLTVGEAGSKIRGRFEAMDEAAKENLLRPAPLKRPATAEEVAAAAAFFASEAASYVSGVGLPVDGAFL